MWYNHVRSRGDTHVELIEMNKNIYVIKTKKYDCVKMSHINATHKFIEKFGRYVLCRYWRKIMTLT